METFLAGARVVVSLAVVLGLLWMLQRRLTRGSRKTSAQHPVTIVTKQAISPKASVVIIDVDGTRLLLGVTEHAVSVLQSGEAPEPVIESVPVIAGPSAAKAFAESLSKVTAAKFTGQKTSSGNMRSLSSSKRPSTGSGDAGPANFTGQSALAGSILSPTTWKQLATTIRQGR